MKRIEDVAARAAKTAVQSFAAFVAANIGMYAAGVTDLDTAKTAGIALLVAALGAAFSAGWNVISNSFAGEIEGDVFIDDDDDLADEEA